MASVRPTSPLMLALALPLALDVVRPVSLGKLLRLGTEEIQTVLGHLIMMTLLM